MFCCPSCEMTLHKTRGKVGMFWHCPSCRGRAVGMELLRKLMPPAVVNALWQRARRGGFTRKRPCPACRRKMYEVPILNDGKTEYLDVCTGCHFIWFDTGEYERMPKTPIPTSELEQLSPEGKDAVALARLEVLKEEAKDRKLGLSGPEHWWELIPGLFGMPIEYDNKQLKHRPVATWTLGAVIVVISVLGFVNLEAAVTNWGLIPARFYRYFGLTFLSSFFLHGGIMHLVGNLYFLLVFGDNIEDVLGKRRFLGLVFSAALAGAMVHVFGDPSSTIPCIGASGGISAIVAYYALRFPHAHVGMLFSYFFWLRLPVFFLFGIWVLLQCLGAIKQAHGLTNVSAFAHLGGAAVGVLYWLYMKQSSGAFSQVGKMPMKIE